MATGNGGAISVEGATLNISGNTAFATNKGENGGAIVVYEKAAVDATDTTAAVPAVSATVTVNGASFTGNETTGSNAYGGAMYIRKGVSLEVSNTSFTGNKAPKGASVSIYGGKCDKLEFTDCQFVENVSTNTGAFYVGSGNKLTMTGITATDNSAKSGGFIYITSANTALTLNSAVISGNTATTTSNGSFIYIANAANVVKINKAGVVNADGSDIVWSDIVTGKATETDISQS